MEHVIVFHIGQFLYITPSHNVQVVVCT